MAIKKGGYIISGAISLIIAGAATVNGMQNAAVTNISLAPADGSDNAQLTEELFQKHEKDNGIEISFTAPITDISDDGALVFSLEQPETIVIVPSTDQYDIGDTISVEGIVFEISEHEVILQDCVISKQSDAPTTKAVASTQTALSTIATPTATTTSNRPIVTESTVATESTTPIPQTTPPTATTDITTDDPHEINITVYVSSTGKYHSKSNCSGMKSYSEMSYENAIKADLVPCKKCW